jgi:hypothetical protein
VLVKSRDAANFQIIPFLEQTAWRHFLILKILAFGDKIEFVQTRFRRRLRLKAAKMSVLRKVWHREFRAYQDELKREGIPETWTRPEKDKKLNFIANFDIVDPKLVESTLLLFLERCMFLHSLA